MNYSIFVKSPWVKPLMILSYLFSRSRILQQKQIKAIARSGLFDEKWYQAHYELKETSLSPIAHYITIGAGLGYDPGPDFSTELYLKNNMDVAEKAVNPLLHYIETGAQEGRCIRPSILGHMPVEAYCEIEQDGLAQKLAFCFDAIYYLTINPDVRQNGHNPMAHFIKNGFEEGRNPAPFIHLNFIKKYYEIGPGDIARFLSVINEACFCNALLTEPVTYADIRPLLANRRVDMSDLFVFDANSFFNTQPDVLANYSKNPILHLFENGLQENRLRTSGFFDPDLIEAPDHLSDLEIVQNQDEPFTYIGFSKLKISRPPQTTLKDVRLAIGVVLYQNSKHEIIRLAHSIVNSIDRFAGAVKVIFLDNSPLELEMGTLAKIMDEVTFDVILCPKNIGFAKGHNALMERSFSADQTHYLGLNPDGYLLGDALSEVLWMCREKGDKGLFELKSEPICHPKYYHPVTGATNWISGAAFLMPRGVHAAVGGFDPDFPMYCEDIDLSFRVREAGFGLYVAQHACFYHDITDRLDEDNPTRAAQMLMGNWYLCKKWGADSRAAVCATELQKLGVTHAEFPEPPAHTAANNIISSLFELPRFSKSRFWQ